MSEAPSATPSSTTADVVQQQRFAPQPNVFIALMLLFACNSGLKLLVGVLVEIPRFHTWTRDHRAEYLATFWVIQMIIHPTAVVYFLSRYRTALFLPRPSPPSRLSKIQITVAAAAGAALLYQLSAASVLIAKLLGYSPYGVEFYRSVHNDAWTAIGTGTTLGHVVFTSYISIVAPALEEIIFTGFVLNGLSRRFRLFIAMPLAAELFALFHLLGSAPAASDALPRLFLHSLIHQSLRVAFGRIELAILFHLLINLCILSPKWLVTFLAFR